MDHNNEVTTADSHSGVKEGEGSAHTAATQGDAAAPNDNYIQEDESLLSISIIFTINGVFYEASRRVPQVLNGEHATLLFDSDGATFYGEGGAVRFDYEYEEDEDVEFLRLDKPTHLVPTQGLFSCYGRVYHDGVIRDLTDAEVQTSMQDNGVRIPEANEAQRNLFHHVNAYNRVRSDVTRLFLETDWTDMDNIHEGLPMDREVLERLVDNILADVQTVRTLMARPYPEDGYVRAPGDVIWAACVLDGVRNKMQQFASMRMSDAHHIIKGVSTS
jgi:hypothetical protein